MDPNFSSPHRRNLRLPEFDYSQPGAYFVTIVTQDRKQLFGEVMEGEMILNDVGMMVKEVWEVIPDHFPNVELGEFIVMPNHIHGIISITNVEATHASPTSAECIAHRDMKHRLPLRVANSYNYFLSLILCYKLFRAVG